MEAVKGFRIPVDALKDARIMKISDAFGQLEQVGEHLR